MKRLQILILLSTAVFFSFASVWGQDISEGCMYFLVFDPACEGGHAYSHCTEINEDSGYIEYTLYDDGCAYVVTA